MGFGVSGATEVIHRMLNTIMEYIGKQKVPLQLVAAVVVSGFLAHGWADMHFVTAARGDDDKAKILAQVERNTTMLVDHLDEYAKNELRKDIKRVKSQQYEVQQFIAVNGANKLSNDRAEELRQELAELQAVELCVTMGGKNCR